MSWSLDARCRPSHQMHWFSEVQPRLLRLHRLVSKLDSTNTKRPHLIIITIIRPHRSTMYVDAAYCYRLSSTVCRFVCLTLVSPAKTAAPIELPFGLRTWVGPGNHVLDGGSISPHGKGQIFGGKWASHCKV